MNMTTSMLNRLICGCLFPAAFLTISSGMAALAEDPPLTSLTGRQIDVELSGRRYLSTVEVEKINQKGDDVTGFVLRSPRDNKRQTVTASQIVEIFLDGQPLDVAWIKSEKKLAYSVEKRQKRVEYETRVGEQLKASSYKLWPRLTPAEMEAAIDENLQHIREQQQRWPERRLEYYDTPWYQICSDMQPADVRTMTAALNALYDSLCDGFDVPRGRNIWRGKCIIYAFKDKAGFLAFESEVYKSDASGAAGKAHWNNGTGRVIINVYQQQSPIEFAGLLTHETTHGFLHRYRSNAKFPAFLNEGICDWAASVVVPQVPSRRARQLSAIDQIRKYRSISEDFFVINTDISGWKYGMGANLAIFLSTRGADRYRQFIDGIKEGLPWQQSLQECYGWTVERMLAEYGRSVGVPDLKLTPLAEMP